MIVGSSTSTLSVKRVITCFILTSSSTDPTTTTTAPADSNNNNNNNNNWLNRDNIRIAIFQREATMPTFPSYWAGISGSIEDNEVPYETAIRELQEETNLIPTITTNIEDDDDDDRDDDNESKNNGKVQPTTTTTTTKNDSNNDGTLLSCEFVKMGGLYLDVPYKENSIIRVYPFLARLRLLNDEETKNKLEIQLKGTEHSQWKFVSIQEMEELSSHCVPGLVSALHHATYGRLLKENTLPQSIWEWSYDHVNGAATLARKAIELAMETTTDYSDKVSDNDDGDDDDLFSTMAMLRPTMVPIVNALKALKEKEMALLWQQQHQRDASAATCDDSSSRRNIRQAAGKEIIQSLDKEVERIIQLGADSLYQIFCNNNIIDNNATNISQSSSSSFVFTIVTFSRSSTILKVIRRFLIQLEKDIISNHVKIQILCSRSTPGNEGEHLAQDLIQTTSNNRSNDDKNMQLSTQVNVECVDDEILHQFIRRQQEGNDIVNTYKINDIDVVLVGSDCVMKDNVINKIGTKALVESVRHQQASPTAATTLICVADGWKIWDDVFPPPLEDIFECVPRDLFDHVIIPQRLDD